MESTRKVLGVAVATVALAGGSLAIAGTAMAKSAALPSGKAPVLRTVITDKGLYVDGPRIFPAGRLKVSLEVNKSHGHSGDVSVIRLHRHYSFKDFRTDVKTFGYNVFGPGGDFKKGIAALDHAVAHATPLGGLDVANGQTRSGMLLLKKPSNRYFIFNDTGNVPKQQQRLTVTSAVGSQKLEKADAKVVARQDKRFGGDKVLPANGLVRFKNRATESPHMWILIHVKKGTTRKQVLKGMAHNDFSFALPGEQGSTAVASNHSDVIHVHQKPGTYVEACFFPDPKTGMPHAFMGMVRIVKLKK